MVIEDLSEEEGAAFLAAVESRARSRSRDSHFMPSPRAVREFGS